MKTKSWTIILALVLGGILTFLVKHYVALEESQKKAEIRMMSGKWQSTFSNQVARSPLLEIIRTDSDEVVFTTQNTNEISQLIGLIEIDEAASGNYCFCGGSLLFAFSQHTTVSFHHGTSLRWQLGKWPGDATLTRRSMINISNWLGLRGIENMEHRRANQRLDPIVKTPGDEVEAQGIQGDS